MDFIQELYEARMTRNHNNMKQFTYTDCCERVYLILLVMELLRNFKQSAEFVQQYAQDTRSYSEFKRFQPNGTDLHNFIYFVTGDESALDRLLNPELARAAQSERYFPVMAVNRYLVQVSNNKKPTQVYEMLTSVESGLRITNSDYKAVRRTILSIDRANTAQIKSAVTKLLLSVRTRLRSSDVISEFERIAAVSDLESETITDKNPVNSRGEQISGTDLHIISGIVGSSNVFMAIKFLDMMAAGDTIPSNVAQAFQPAVNMLTDIIRGGPSYITALRSLQRQANRKNNS